MAAISCTWKIMIIDALFVLFNLILDIVFVDARPLIHPIKVLYIHKES